MKENERDFQLKHFAVETRSCVVKTMTSLLLPPSSFPVEIEQLHFQIWTIVMISFLFFRHICQPAIELFSRPSQLIFPASDKWNLIKMEKNLNELNFWGLQTTANDKVFRFEGEFVKWVTMAFVKFWRLENKLKQGFEKAQIKLQQSFSKTHFSYACFLHV